MAILMLILKDPYSHLFSETSGLTGRLIWSPSDPALTLAVAGFSRSKTKEVIHSPMSEPSLLSPLPSHNGKTAIWAPGVARQITDNVVFPIKENNPIVSTPLIILAILAGSQIRFFHLHVTDHSPL